MYDTTHRVIFIFNGCDIVLDTHDGTIKRLPNNVLSKILYPEYEENSEFIFVPRVNEYKVPKTGLYKVHYNSGDSNFIVDQLFSEGHIITYKPGQYIKIQGYN